MSDRANDLIRNECSIFYQPGSQIGWIQCRHCGAVIYDIIPHFESTHPEVETEND